MLVWQEKEELLAPEVFHALTTALRREPRLRFTLTEVNDLPVRQTPMFTLLREADFQVRHKGWIWDRERTDGCPFASVSIAGRIIPRPALQTCI